MGRGKRGGGGSRSARGKQASRQSKFFSSDLPDPHDGLAQVAKGSGSWSDQYYHSSRASFDCQGCGKIYTTFHHLTTHERTCFSNKRNLSTLLQTSKTFWEARKRRKLEALNTTSSGTDSTNEQQALNQVILRSLCLSNRSPCSRLETICYRSTSQFRRMERTPLPNRMPWVTLKIHKRPRRVRWVMLRIKL